nr:helix-turn-helix domain-containing protein [Bifidobacterium longum]
MKGCRTLGQVHSHLSEEERQIIQIEIDNGTSIRRIAGLIGRHASTVSREIVLLQCLLGGFGSVFPQHPIEHIHTPTPSWTGSYTTPPS